MPVVLSLSLGFALLAAPVLADQPGQTPQSPLQRLAFELMPYFKGHPYYKGDPYSKDDPYTKGDGNAIIAILNIAQTTHDKDGFVKAFTKYLHDEQSGWRHGDELHSDTILTDDQIITVAGIVGNRYDDYIKSITGPALTRNDGGPASGQTPVTAPQTAPPTAPPSAQPPTAPPPAQPPTAHPPAQPPAAYPPAQTPTAPPPPPTSEIILRELATTVDRHDPSYAALMTKASQMASTRKDFNAAYQGYASIPQDRIPNAAAMVGMAEAAYQERNFALAREDAARALKISPDDQNALSLYHLSDSRVAKVDLKSASLGFGAPDSLSASLEGGAQAARSRAPLSGAAAGATADRTARSVDEAKAAQVALKLGDWPAAVSHADTALQLDPANDQALAYRAMAFIRLDRYDEAERDAGAALALKPGNAAAREIRLWARGRQGHWREALSDADALVAAAPDSAYAHYGRAFAMTGLGDRAAALAELRRAAELDPGFRAKYDQAVQMPQNEDMALLFGGEFDGSKPAPAAPVRAPGAPTPTALAAAAGAALLLLLALLLVFYPEKMRTLRRPAPALASARGALQGRYELGPRIGAGGMGVVHEARDLALGRRVALKKIREENRLDARERERFVQEARIVARMKHENIVDVYSVFEEDGETYLALEYVEGRNLHELIASGGPLDFAEALRLFRSMCAAVEHAHAAQVIHRDLKPANVMVTPQGGVKVMDFGVSRRVQEAAARTLMTNTVVGTPHYMAPEQERGEVRRESDNYALAVCLYEMVTGRLPFAGAGSALALAKMEGKILPAAGKFPLPAGFDAAMARSLSPDPDKRPRTPAALLAEFEALVPASA